MAPTGEMETVGPFIRILPGHIMWLDFGVDPNESLLDQHIEQLEAWSSRNTKPVGVVAVLHSAVPSNATMRRKLAALDKRIAAHDEKYVRACGIVAPNSITRGIVTAVFWMAPPVYPYRLFEESEPALQWVKSELGVPVDAG